MTNFQEQYSDAVRTSQQAAVGALESWTKSVQQAFGQVPGRQAASVDPNQVIDQVFDFAEKMLEVQRDFAKNLANASTAVSGAVRQQAEVAGDAVRQSAESVTGAVREQVDSAREATLREAAESYDELTKPELQEELGRRDLPKAGNVDELRQRLRADDAEKAK